MKKHPRLEVLFPGIMIQIRNEEDEKKFPISRRIDLIAILTTILLLIGLSVFVVAGSI